MTAERKGLLNSIGFDWGEPQKEWQEMYQRLIEYKSTHSGDTDVPISYEEDPQLGEWVKTQRRVYKTKRMPGYRASLLKSIGFHWNTKRRSRLNPTAGVDAVFSNGARTEIKLSDANNAGGEAVSAGTDIAAAVGFSDTDAQFHAAAAHLHELARTLSPYDESKFPPLAPNNAVDTATDSTKTDCTRSRRTSQASLRMLCNIKTISSDINSKVFKSDIAETYYFELVGIDMVSFESPSFGIIKKL